MRASSAIAALLLSACSVGVSGVAGQATFFDARGGALPSAGPGELGPIALGADVVLEVRDLGGGSAQVSVDGPAFTVTDVEPRAGALTVGLRATAVGHAMLHVERELSDSLGLECAPIARIELAPSEAVAAGGPPDTFAALLDARGTAMVKLVATRLAPDSRILFGGPVLQWAAAGGNALVDGAASMLDAAETGQLLLTGGRASVTASAGSSTASVQIVGVAPSELTAIVATPSAATSEHGHGGGYDLRIGEQAYLDAQVFAGPLPVLGGDAALSASLAPSGFAVATLSDGRVSLQALAAGEATLTLTAGAATVAIPVRVTR